MQALEYLIQGEANMGTDFNALKHYEKLLAVFERDKKTAEVLINPNPGDSLLIRAAIIGFSYNSATENWGKNHYEYVRSRIDQYDSRDDNEIALFALCLGYLLGLFQESKISEDQINVAEMQLYGFIMQKGLHREEMGSDCG